VRETQESATGIGPGRKAKWKVPPKGRGARRGLGIAKIGASRGIVIPSQQLLDLHRRDIETHRGWVRTCQAGATRINQRRDRRGRMRMDTPSSRLGYCPGMSNGVGGVNACELHIPGSRSRSPDGDFCRRGSIPDRPRRAPDSTLSCIRQSSRGKGMSGRPSGCVLGPTPSPHSPDR
jgi:hypothetical protein